MSRKNNDCDSGTIFSNIPDQIIFNILICLPLDIILSVMRCVCKDWYNMINSPLFIYSHLEKSISGLLVQRCSSIVSGNFVKTTKCEVKAKELKFKFPGIVVASCNGLVLLANEVYDTFYVANPFINQQLVLPKITWNFGFAYGFAYADSSKVYKVVNYSCEGHGCEILTLGLDKTWRTVDTGNLMCKEYIFNSPLSLGGFVHSTDWGQSVLSLEVETEKLKISPFLADCRGTTFKILAMGSSLLLMFSKGEYLWEIWLLMDPKTGDWVKLYDIDLQSQECLLQRTLPSDSITGDVFAIYYLFQNNNCLNSETFLCPLGWLQNGEALVLRVEDREDFWIVYNVKTKGVHLYKPTGTMITMDGDPLISHAHVHSLVPLNFVF